MQRIGPGQYQVSAKEDITVKIEKSVGQWLVAISDLKNSTWNPKPANGTEGSFQCPATAGQEARFSALYNFKPGGPPSGDFYTVTFKGENGTSSTSFIDAPALQDRTYSFKVKS